MNNIHSIFLQKILTMLKNANTDLKENTTMALNCASREEVTKNFYYYFITFGTLL